MAKNWLHTIALCCAIFLNFCVVKNMMSELFESFDYGKSSLYLETPKPKINVLESSLCRKCKCYAYKPQTLDCSYKSMTNWFDDEEWNILQSGDFYFEIINLEHNRLTDIPQLRTYPVKKLSLGFNLINYIAIGAFSNLTELTELDLSHNKLTSKVMYPDVFTGLERAECARFYYYEFQLCNLQVLNLANNELHSLDSDLFSNIPNLSELNLSKNTFQTIDRMTEIAIRSTNVKALDLSYMELKYLPDKFLLGPNLETLILTGNLFDEVPELGRLRRLVLDENPIAILRPQYETSKPRSLEYLSISYMPKLKHIARGVFGNFPNLTELRIIQNPKLSTIDANAFGKDTFPSKHMIIGHHSPLTKLYLYGNNLTRLEYDVHVQWADLGVLDLRNNPWECSCSNKWFITELMGYIYSRDPFLTSGVNCFSPAALKSVALIDLYPDETLVCGTGDQSESYILIIVALLIVILIGILLVLFIIFMYRRNCSRLCNHNDSADKKLQYEPI